MIEWFPPDYETKEAVKAILEIYKEILCKRNFLDILEKVGEDTKKLNKIGN